MAITFPLGLPAGLRITAVAGPSLTVAAAVSRSPFTGQQQVYEWHSVWGLSFDLYAARRSDARRLEAFLAALRGRVGTALLGPMHYAKPRGTAGTVGVTLGVGATAGARSVTLAGVGASKTLLAGDYLQLGTGENAKLHQVVEDAAASVAGVVTVTLEPPLRAAYSSGTDVVLSNPKGAFRLTTDTPTVATAVNGGGTVSLAWEEAL